MAAKLPWLIVKVTHLKSEVMYIASDYDKIAGGVKTIVFGERNTE